MLCLNPKCRATLREYQWGEGYCSGECMEVCLDKGATLTMSLHRPTTGHTLCATHDEEDAFAEAYRIDPRLPRVIYLRRACLTFQEIGQRMKLDASTCNRILHCATRKLLRRCGLRPK